MDDNNAVRSRGFTLIELLIVIAVVGILVAVAVPWVLRARMAGNESAAVSSLGAINEAQMAYRITCGNGRYAPSLSALGQPIPTTGEAFLSPDLTAADTIVKSGYQFTMSAPAPTEHLEVPWNPGNPFGLPAPDGAESWTGCNDVLTVEGYLVLAEPVRPGNTGRRFFATNTSRVIYEHTESLAESMPMAGPPAAGRELR
jgi:prepilin-type N-terminal cleavage/methylation domain-containing protein